jgi:hypothetical protein
MIEEADFEVSRYTSRTIYLSKDHGVSDIWKRSACVMTDSLPKLEKFGGNGLLGVGFSNGPSSDLG